MITATASGYTSGSDKIDVTDDDTALLTLSITRANISEKGGSSQARVIRNTGAAGNLVVTLISRGESEATVTSPVTIPNGSDFMTFTVRGLDDPDGWILKLNPNGDIDWQKAYADDGAVNNEFFSSVQQTSDGGYVVVGTKGAENGLGLSILSAFILKFDSNGNIGSSCGFVTSTDVVPADTGALGVDTTATPFNTLETAVVNLLNEDEGNLTTNTRCP